MFVAAALLQALAASPQVSDLLGVPGPIELGGQSYRLAWSAQPSPATIKQEYVPAGQEVEQFRHMLLIETVADKPLREVVRDKLRALQKRKASDPVQQMAVMENEAGDEAIVDFVMSATLPSGQYVVEWNAYRYASYRDRHGRSGTQLLGLSARGYDDDVTAFLQGLKAFRPRQIEALSRAPLPAVAAR
jgi:hypothetical protein